VVYNNTKDEKKRQMEELRNRKKVSNGEEIIKKVVIDDDMSECYMQELYDFDVTKAVFINSRHFSERKVNGEEYRDPDLEGKKIYEDEWKVFFANTDAKLEKGPYGYGIIVNVNGKNVKLSSDYIGPSATAAYNCGIADEAVWNTILRCRTIGGHILWPSHRDSINQARASIKDRIDLTLDELKNYFEGHSGYKYSSKLRNAFETDKEWLAHFGSFEGFCDFYYLKGSFVDENYNVIFFADPNWENVEFAYYMRNNIEAVELRNKIIKRNKGA